MTVVDRTARLTGHVAVVTGGAVGLGAAIAIGLAHDGASVAILDLDGYGAAAMADGLAGRGGAAWGGWCDVADQTSVEAAFATVETTVGPTSILVNNAGLYEGFTDGFAGLDPAARERLFAVNVHGVVGCTMAAAAQMRTRRGGAVVNIASEAGFHCRTPYGVSKLAVRGITVALATELASDGIRVNAVAPGLVGTEHALAHVGEARARERVERLQLIGRPGEVDDVVDAVRFLVSDRASFVTGETLRVSGGAGLFV
jgi:NAD(P)-dependent dehydrogenase (short-subunit alcohol dehydrogenase family)